MTRRRLALSSLAIGLTLHLVRRSKSPGHETDESDTTNQKPAKEQERATETGEQVERHASEHDYLDRQCNKVFHGHNCAPEQTERTRLSLRDGLDEVFKASLSSTLAFAVLVAIWAAAVAVRYSTEALEVATVVISGLAAVVLAEGLMDVLLKRVFYVALGLLMAVGVGAADSRLSVSRWLHGWVAASGLAVVVFLLWFLVVSGRRRPRSGGSVLSSADSRRLRVQLVGLFLVAVALALQARLALFEHPVAAFEASSAEQKTDRLPPQMFNVGSKRAAIVSQVSALRGQVCRLESEAHLRPAAFCKHP